jgi:pyroglutamyl-peptidase
MHDVSRCRLLMTGFEPFGRHRINSSWEAVRLAGPRLGKDVVIALLPVDRRRAAARVVGLLERHRPQACLLTGLARGRTPRIERTARRPWQLGSKDDPARLEGSWPAVEVALALKALRLPVRMSRNAGRYVCESTYWALLNHCLRNAPEMDTAFVHVPPLSPRFTAEALSQGLEAVARRRLARLAPRT